MIKRTVTLEQMNDGWVVTDSTDGRTWNIIDEGDLANILHPDGELEIIDRKQALYEILMDIEVLPW